MNKTQKVLTLLFCIQVCAVALSANPFTGKQQSPTPTYSGARKTENAEQQRRLNALLGDYLHKWSEQGSVGVLAGIMLLSAVYGLLHAMGPGHRKTVVFSYYLTRTAPAYEPALIGFALSCIHGLSAVALMVIFREVSGSFTAKTNDASIYMEGISFLLLAILAIYSLWNGLRRLRGTSECSCAVHQHKKKTHNGACEKDSAATHTHEKARLRMLLLSSVYPCPSIIMIAVLTLSLDIWVVGILSAVTLSIGMSIPIIASGYLAWAGRTGLFAHMQKHQKSFSNSAVVLELIGYSVILFISVRALIPFIAGFF